MAQSNEERVRLANAEIVEKGNMGAVDKVFATDYVVHLGGKEARGTEFVKSFVGQLRSAIPDLRVVALEFLMQGGETLAWRRTLSGTFKADMMGIPASGQKVEWRDMMISRFEGGQIAEEWAVSELAGQLLLSIPTRA